MERRIGIMMCAFLAPEMEAVVRQEGWQDVEILPLGLCCLACGLRLEALPLKPPPKVNPDLDLHHIRCSSQLGFAEPVAAQPITDHAIDNCFKAFLPGPIIDQLTGDGAYLVTPGWLANWQDHLASMGFGGDGAREMFKEFAQRIMLLDTGLGETAVDDCREFSWQVGLPFSITATGLDHATLFLRDIVQGARLAQQNDEILRLQRKLNETRASSEFILTVQSDLSLLRDEFEVVEKIHQMFTVLFSPQVLAVVSLQRGQIRYAQPEELSEESAAAFAEFLRGDHGEEFQLTEDGLGFFVRFGHSLLTNGAALVSRFSFPENHAQYLNQALALAPMCKLVIARARALHGIVPVCSHCHHIRDSKDRWHSFEKFLSFRTEALFSHTICPACAKEHYPSLIDELPGQD